MRNGDENKVLFKKTGLNMSFNISGAKIKQNMS
jgi:hypothetical protein